MTRVIFLIESPFNERDYNRFGIEILQQNGFEVEVWDFTPFLHPEIQHVKVLDPIDYGNHHQFLTRNEAVAAIFELPRSCFVVCFIGYRYSSFPIYRAISKGKLRYCISVTNVVPIPPINTIQSPINFLTKLRQSSPAKLFNSFYLRIPFNYLGLRPATLLLAGGEGSIRYSSLITRETAILWAHALDYDLYLKEKDEPIQVDTNMGVFLDEYLPFHPDFVSLGLAPPSSPEEYYPKLCKFFDLLEREYGVRIVIAAHPRSDYEDRSDYFGGRPVLKGQTAAVVRKSGFAIAHSSRSLRFAVLFNKPVLFITTNSIQQSALKGPYVLVMSSCFNKTPINLDEPFYMDWEKELTVDQAAYARYREGYIKKSGSPEKPCWQIFADFLKTLEAESL